MVKQTELGDLLKRCLRGRVATHDETLAALAVGRVVAAGAHRVAAAAELYNHRCVNAHVSVWRVSGHDGAELDFVIRGELVHNAEHIRKLRTLYLVARALEELDTDGADDPAAAVEALKAFCEKVRT